MCYANSMDNKYNLLGKRFNMWLVLSRAASNSNQDAYWLCRCDCGTERAVKGSFLRREMSTNCGCRRARTFGERLSLAPGEGAVRQLFRTYKQMAKFKKREFALSLEEFKLLTKGDCHYCGAAPSQTVTRKHNGGKTLGTTYLYNGVDRVDSILGYTLSNCVSACGVHNKMKLTMSQADFLAACEAVVNFYGRGARLEQAPTQELMVTN